MFLSESNEFGCGILGFDRFLGVFMFDFTRKASEVSNGVCSNCGFGVVCA